MIYWVINLQNLLHCPHYLNLLKADIERLMLVLITKSLPEHSVCINPQTFSPTAGIYCSQNLSTFCRSVLNSQFLN